MRLNNIRVSKIILIAAIAIGLAVSVAIPFVKAATLSTTNLLRSVSVLGVGVIRSDTYPLSVYDMTGATTTVLHDLPSLEGIDGQMYVIKRIGGDCNSQDVVEIRPFEGDNVDGSMNYVYLYCAGVVTLAADEEAGTWWVINVYGTVSM
jgi:hypothetical protein